ncbi:MAG: hypothetical protein U0271_03715 [Polyangiaceae bacterium]
MSVLGSLFVACAVCANPNLATQDGTSAKVQMGTSMEVRAGGLGVGPADAMRVDEMRFESGLSFQVLPELELSASVPFLLRSYEFGDDRTGLELVMGDVGISAFARVMERFAPHGMATLHHRVWLAPTIKFPTAPAVEDPSGVFLPSNLQPGCSSVVPQIAAVYELGEALWAVRFGGGAAIPFAVRDAPHRGPYATAVVEADLRPVPDLGLRLGWKWLFEATGSDATSESEPDSGGLIGYLSASVDARYGATLYASAGVDVPLVLALRGEQSPTPIVMLRFGGRWDLVR